MHRMFTASLVAAALALLACQSMAQMSVASKGQISSGISSGQSVVAFISTLGDPKVDKMFDNLGKMAGFLGAAGGLISFALSFLPSQESAQLRYMKQKFSEVNMKLDKITTVLDDVKDLITYENQRAAYVTSASRILFGHKQLTSLMEELQHTNCSTVRQCYRIRAPIASRYANHLNIKANLYVILNGATKPTSAFGDPLLQTVKTTGKCDIGKLDHFANSVLKLAFKAQQVILAHEKMTGSNESITRSMNDWLESVYNVRQYTFKMKNECYSNIRQYVYANIKDNKYQVGVSSNHEANNQLKAAMDNKYPWLGWNIYSYQAYGGSKHCILGTYGAFWSMPKGQSNRKRNLISSFYDKKGTYKNQKSKVIQAIKEIKKEVRFYTEVRDACRVMRKFESHLKIKGVFKYIASLNALRPYGFSNLVIKKSDNELSFIKEDITLADGFVRPWSYVLIISLKSEEQAAGVQCNLGCGGEGKCVVQQYSSSKSCQCKPNYQGTNCEDNTKSQLSKTVDAMLETTLKIPMMSDIYFDIKDMREYLGISFGKIQSAISEVERTLEKYMNNGFERANLITHYSHAIKSVKYYAYRFENLQKQYPKSTETQGKKLAEAVLRVEGIQKWLFEINFLFLGRYGTPLLNHKPLMYLFMEKHISKACTAKYKALLDQMWQQMVLLQQVGFLVWAQALEFKGKPTKMTEDLYKQRVANQISQMEKKTCKYVVQNSAKLHCAGGFYLHQGMTIENKCSNNYHVVGSIATSCGKKQSECKKCSCNPLGTQQCEDMTGKCHCKPGFYGDTCDNRDCVWGHWGPWATYGNCYKLCGYRGSKARTRVAEITREGKGKDCKGSAISSPGSCSNGCCKEYSTCAKKGTCIKFETHCA